MVIENRTGKIIDVEVLSICKGHDLCKWQKGHDGNWGLFEYFSIQKVIVLWYIYHIGDGDSKTCSTIAASNPYG